MVTCISQSADTICCYKSLCVQHGDDDFCDMCHMETKYCSLSPYSLKRSISNTFKSSAGCR
ncbi:hypothetical protein J6590_008333 [Homalodisca vitripennis]|nr:hypothetical protein J6590_008333 [Homalodisca vitripennis]